ncbi:hypothetical protein [Ensifer adhaerens]|uniref:hypothetical protein n=1 Tax=Ensifer adhaerens TaxID=106592 RepID=UPI00098FAEC5|nr:hypothetical protein [Ensifer adhaerens]
MTTLRIYGPPGEALPFDLRDFLQVLAPHSLSASWRVLAVGAGYRWFDATGPGGDILDQMAQAGEPVDGGALHAAAQDTLQVIWGEFSGFLPSAPHRTWVTIRAIDSTFYEVTTDDAAVVERIETGFDDVRRFDAIWAADDGASAGA